MLGQRRRGDHTLIVGDTYGTLHAYDVSDTAVNPAADLDLHAQERERHRVHPAVWKGRSTWPSGRLLYCFGD